MLHIYAVTLLLSLATSCASWELALKFFKQASYFLPILEDPQPEMSATFDSKSLMIYDSWVGKAEGQAQFPLMGAGRHSDKVILMGGNANWDLAGPSRFDKERIWTLYPAPQNQQQAP